MGRRRLLQWYHNYALLIGVTSHRLVDGRFFQTWQTRTYTLVLNVLLLLALPIMFWHSTQYISANNWFPNLVPFTSYIFYSVSYVAIAYTVISRGSRDSALVEVERIVTKLKLHKRHEVGRFLYWLFYLKLMTLVYSCLSNISMCLLLPESKWYFILFTVIFYNATNMPAMATYRYFLALWNITCGYQCINCSLEDITRSAQSRFPTRIELEELHKLWSLHSLLGRCTLSLNKVYEILMLTTRLDYVTFSVINGYWGMLFLFSVDTPFYMIFFGAFNYWVRFVDFYLLDVMCEMTINFQSCPHHAITEGYWFKELNAYLIYASSSKLKLWICGLYQVNRSCYFQMMNSILAFSILLLQFHLIMRDKFAL